MLNNQALIKTSTEQATQKIGDYLIDRTLGEGTFGKVKLGIHVFTGEKVAIKILQKEKILDEGDKMRVFREISILKQIKHPNLIQLYEIIETQSEIYLIMEYAYNGELYEYIVKRKKLPETEAFFFFQQILSGLEYLHQLNISHRDLKLENLLLSDNNILKIVDFGLSNFYPNNLLLRTSCGSPCYAAPEMILGQRYDGLKTDLWSLGIILFAMTCGYLPFENKDTTIMYKKVVKGEFEIPKHVSENLRVLIKGLLTVDCQKRFSIENIRECKWFVSLKTSDEYKGIIIGLHEIPVDLFILGVLENFHISRNDIELHLKKNHHNRLTSLYYLLLEKYIREGGNSPANIKSLSFTPKLLESQKINNEPLIFESELTRRKKNNIKVISSINNVEKILKTEEMQKNQKTQDIKPKERFHDSVSIENREPSLASSMNSPKIKFIPSALAKKQEKSDTNEKKQNLTNSDRFKNATSCDTIRKLEKFFKEKKFENSFSGVSKNEKNNKNKLLQLLSQKYKKSQSFYQTKFFNPSQINQTNKTKINNTNVSITTSITPKHTKSIHSQNFKQKKLGDNDIKKNSSKEKERFFSNHEKNSSLDQKIKNNLEKKILNVTLMDLKMRNKNHSKEKKQNSLSLDKPREKDITQNKNANNYVPLKTEIIQSFDAKANFFSNETGRNTRKTSQETYKKSYYQLASLLKEKSLIKNIQNQKNIEKPSRSRFTSVYSMKTESPCTKKSNDSLHTKNVYIKNSNNNGDSSSKSRSNSKSFGQIKNKIDSKLNTFKMFSTLTKREKEGNQNNNDSSVENRKKTIKNESNCYVHNFKKEMLRPQKDIINIESLLRFSKKIQNLKTVPTE